MSRAEWLRERQLGLGGSDLGQIPSIVEAVGGDPAVDCSPWGGEWHVWASKRGEPEEGNDSPQMAIGRWLEGPILEWARDELGAVSCTAHVASVAHSIAPLRATPDGVIMYGTTAQDDRTEGVECKVAHGFRVWDDPPLYYQLQARACMAVLDMPGWHIAAFFRSIPARRIYTIHRDLDIERRMLNAVTTWWDRHIIDEEPPEVDDSVKCTRALARLHPREAGTSYADLRVATDNEIALCGDIARLESVIADIATDARRQRNVLRASIGDAAGLRWAGGKAKWSRNRLKITIEGEES